MKDLAALAAKYRRKPTPRCGVCKLGSERLKDVRGLKIKHGLSLSELSAAIRGEFGVNIGDGALQNHFANHEAGA